MIYRIEKFREGLKSNTSGAIISSWQNIKYLSGFSGTNAKILITDDNAYFYTDSRYKLLSRQSCDGFLFLDDEAELFNIIKEKNIKCLGIEEDTTTIRELDRLKAKCPDIIFDDISRLISDLRSVKTAEELDILKKAQQITDDAFTHILKYIKRGVSERDIAVELEFYMRRNGASGVSFDMIIASGERSCMPHGLASEKVIDDGFLTLDFGCIYDGYCSDMTRTVCVGEPSSKMKNIYDVVLDTQERAISRIKAGIMAKDVYAFAKSIISDSGFGNNFNHGLGHGLGLNIHEYPYLSSKSEDILKENMIVTVEPGIYIDNLYGVRIEDVVIVNKLGCENITKSSKKLIIL